MESRGSQGSASGERITRGNPEFWERFEQYQDWPLRDSSSIPECLSGYMAVVVSASEGQVQVLEFGANQTTY